MTPRIGLGIDLHRLAAGRPCRLGGVAIPSDVGPVGHSDGDAVLHAVCDAVLGAAGLDDLGTLFSDRDPRHRDRASAEFCDEVVRRIGAIGLAVLSIDVVVETERPKLAPHRQAIRASIARLFHTDVARVNVKGKTGEGLDSIGRGEALRATAIALVGGTTPLAAADAHP
jgi:2-C-methyl-D-erythritol 2,4-cyclodiphosphate synthase